MAAPQLSEASIKNSRKIVLTFDQAIDTGVNVPLISFSVNYGKVAVTRWDYFGNAAIVLQLAKAINYRDKLEVNYQPPDDIQVALRAPVKVGATQITLRRNAVRAFFKVPVLNLLRTDESSWNEMSNLGVSTDGKNGGDSPDSEDNGGGSWNPCGGTPDPNGTGPGGSQGGAEGYGSYPIRVRPNPRTATPDDFVLAYGLREAIQLTNIDNADAIEPNTDKLWMAIQDACALIDNYIIQASRGGKLLISSNRRRTALIIARYYLDTVRRRDDVKEDYERCLKELDKASTTEDIIRPDAPWWQDPCNPNRGCGVRSWRVPQTYNGVSGKGLSGWWSDSGGAERADWRYDRLNSEVNNDDANWKRASTGTEDARAPVQPADDGGSRYSGNSNSP